MLRRTALRDLAALFSIGTPEAKSYALVALYQLDRRRFEQLLIQSGCMVSVEIFPELIRRIEAGGYSLRLIDQRNLGNSSK